MISFNVPTKLSEDDSLAGGVFSDEGVAAPLKPATVGVGVGESAGEVETEAELFGTDPGAFPG
jgi:hypothetical protein